MRVANIIEDVDLIDLFSHFIPFSFIILAIRFTLEFKCSVFGFHFDAVFVIFFWFLLTLHLHAMHYTHIYSVIPAF